MEDGSTIELGENFQDGDFGIRLLDTPADPVITNTIVGDLTPVNNPFQYNFLGNVITDPNNSAPDRNDILYDSFLDDRIEGRGGNDTINATRGGDDWILGGSGRDAISAGLGNDIAEGNSGADAIMGGTGNDQLFGENKGEMEDIIAAGETATGINEKGDLVLGAAGNDFLYGSNKKDALFGGEGNKRQAKGYRREAIGNYIFKKAA
ncbi:MAG: hypothetical protein HY957_11060 [Nitrospirae bacterium]|nr:hypothetical protein [Nitrospirota bacterium]